MTDTTLIDSQTVTQRRARSRSQIYVDIRRGVMTPPLSPRAGRKSSVWPAAEIEALNRAEIAGATDDELRELVLRLIAQRAEGRPLEAAAA